MSKEVYHPFPKFENSIYRLANIQKERLRDEAIRRIKSGEFTSLYVFYDILNSLKEEEIKEIVDTWNSSNLETLSLIYEKALKTLSKEQIQLSDRSYILYKYCKEYGGMRR